MRVIHKSALASYTVVLAEDPKIFSPIGEYTELLKFELDVAQLAELLLLFSESAGSLVELGMFVVDPEVSSKLMVVMDDHSFKQESFVVLGPVFSLRHHFTDDAVCVLRLSDLKIRDTAKLENLDTGKLLEVLNAPLKNRLNQKREPTTFDKNRNGHITKLIIGLIQHYGALTYEEIEDLLNRVGAPLVRSDLKKHIQCAERFGWLYAERVGVRTFCAARSAAKNQAIDFKLIPGNPIKDRARWQSDVREYWQQKDPDRYSVIKSALLGRRS